MESKDESGVDQTMNSDAVSIIRRLRGLSESPPLLLDLIDKNLYLAGLMEISNVDTLKQHKITHILTVNTIPLPQYLIEACPYLTVKFIQTDDIPESDLLSRFGETFDFIEEGVARGAVVVHCMAGMSRSATVVIAYLMKKYSLSYLRAYALVAEKRLVCPNTGFVKQLKQYEAQCYAASS